MRSKDDELHYSVIKIYMGTGRTIPYDLVANIFLACVDRREEAERQLVIAKGKIGTPHHKMVEYQCHNEVLKELTVENILFTLLVRALKDEQ